MLTGGMLDSHDGKPGAQFDRIRKNIRLDRYKPLVEVNQANKILVVLDKDIQFNWGILSALVPSLHITKVVSVVLGTHQLFG